MSLYCLMLILALKFISSMISYNLWLYITKLFYGRLGCSQYRNIGKLPRKKKPKAVLRGYLASDIQRAQTAGRVTIAIAAA
jgi:hypothetical protein